MKVLIGTKNSHKVQEFRDALKGSGLEIICLTDLPKNGFPEPIENGMTFQENAEIKARYYYEMTKIPCLCDDSGLCVECLDNSPGIFSARYSGGNDLDNRNLLRINLNDRFPARAYFNCDLVFYDGITLFHTSGQVYGEIIDEERGNDGFGYDNIFYYPPFKKTFGELSLSEKNTISHRFIALQKMVSLLTEYYRNINVK